MSAGWHASISETRRWGKSLNCSHVGSGEKTKRGQVSVPEVSSCQSAVLVSICGSLTCRLPDKGKQAKGQTVWAAVQFFTEVAGWWLQVPVKAALSCGVAALLVRMLAVEGHDLPMRHHGVSHIKGPTLHPSDDHTAPLGRDQTASCHKMGPKIQ